MNDLRLKDLDELVLMCRTQQAREYIKEAVVCLKTGANRSAIIACWIAVVFDIMDKLRELEIGGSQPAHAFLARVQQARESGNLQDSLAIERELVATAAGQDYELFSPIELVDLERLRDDRNRCAHPSLSDESTPYHPSEELVRSHIRNAVEYVLSRPPVQGRLALDRIWAEIGSPAFPTDLEAAIVRIHAGPLQRARTSLIRSVLVGLTRSLLGEDKPADERKRCFAALAAVERVHQATAEMVVREDFPRTLDQYMVSRPERIVELLRYFPSAWTALPPGHRQTLRQHVGTAAPPNRLALLIDAAQSEFLRPDVEILLRSANSQICSAVVNECTHPSIIAAVVERWAGLDRYQEISAFRGFLLPRMLRHCDVGTYRRLIASLSENEYVWRYMGRNSLFGEVIRDSRDRLGNATDEWRRLYDRLTPLADADPSARALMVTLHASFASFPQPPEPAEEPQDNPLPNEREDAVPDGE